MTNRFYIVMTGDASKDQYPENKPADFTMQLTSQLHLSEDLEVAMTRIIYPHSWQNVREHQLSYTLLCKTGPVPWTLTIYLSSGIYIIHGILKGLHNALGDIYLKSENTITSLGGNDCFYIHKKAQDFYDLTLPQGWYVTLPKTLARTLGYLNYQYHISQLYQIGQLVKENKDRSVFLMKTTTTLVREKELVWGLLSPHAFETMYMYSDLVESHVVVDTLANVLHILVPRGQPCVF